MNFNSYPNSVEVSADESIITVTHGNSVSFLTADGLVYFHFDTFSHFFSSLVLFINDRLQPELYARN